MRFYSASVLATGASKRFKDKPAIQRHVSGWPSEELRMEGLPNNSNRIRSPAVETFGPHEMFSTEIRTHQLLFNKLCATPNNVTNCNKIIFTVQLIIDLNNTLSQQFYVCSRPNVVSQDLLTICLASWKDEIIMHSHPR